MGKFDSLLSTKNSKRTYNYDFNKLYKKGRFSTSVDYEYFENVYVKELLNKNYKKKYDETLLTLWGHLDMRSYIDYDLGNTINLYFVNGSTRIPINQLENYNYMYEDARKANLLDIKYIKHLTLKSITFNDLYLATFEIANPDNQFKPYVLLFARNEYDKLEEIGYGYDSNNNGNVELFIRNFNYPIFLTHKGSILFPLENKKIKLDIYDYISDEDIAKI